MLRCKGDFLYTGSTNNLEKRLGDHERGCGSRFVRSRLPFDVVKTISCADRKEAMSLEARFKRLRKNRKLQLIEMQLDAAGYLDILGKERRKNVTK